MGFWRGIGNFFTGIDTSRLDRVPSTTLDPETQANLKRSIEASRSLRGRPLLSGMAASQAGEQAMLQQARATGGAPERQYSVGRAGAGMGAKILGRYGQPMAGEAVGRQALGTQAAHAASRLNKGQAMHSLSERLKNYMAKKGIDLNQQAATQMAISAGLGFAADVWGPDIKQGLTTDNGSTDSTDSSSSTGLAPPYMPTAKFGRGGAS